MRPHRRYLTFSLRTLFILLTALAVWLGVVVNRAREQREAVEAMEAMGAEVYYDWQVQHTVDAVTQHNLWSFDIEAVPPGPNWLRSLIGDEYFQDVDVVYLDKLSPDVDILTTIPHLRQFRKMKVLAPPPYRDEFQNDKFKESLPACCNW